MTGLSRAPYVLYGVKHVDPVYLAHVSGVQNGDETGVDCGGQY